MDGAEEIPVDECNVICQLSSAKHFKLVTSPVWWSFLIRYHRLMWLIAITHLTPYKRLTNNTIASRWSFGETKMRPLIVKQVAMLTSVSLITDFSPVSRVHKRQPLIFHVQQKEDDSIYNITFMVSNILRGS